jgi:hypothetical protein
LKFEYKYQLRKFAYIRENEKLVKIRGFIDEYIKLVRINECEKERGLFF